MRHDYQFHDAVTDLLTSRTDVIEVVKSVSNVVNVIYFYFTIKKGPFKGILGLSNE